MDVTEPSAVSGVGATANDDATADAAADGRSTTTAKVEK